MKPSTSFIFSAWSESYGSCSPFTFTAQLGNGSPLPVFIALTSSTRKFVIQAQSDLDSGVY
jgi:hypothetical protein